ncbi:hypothetical protein [Hymenobacter psoromatis]|uniref:hypothetical protein n=1 Tax=Hymenobacter psoromatis TaxID=1484116 RepID=UPI001CC1171C|nr:hypothetical protein [Hymenobacter psoromatis]
MRVSFRLPLLAVVLFCLTSMKGCPNGEPKGQFTVAQGYVINRRTNQPLPGIRMAIVSAPTTLKYYDSVVDTVLTDSQGHYELSFTNSKGLFYGINCEVLDTYNNLRPSTLDFPDSLINGLSGYPSLATVDLALGRTNNVKFWPSPRRVWLVQLNTLTTGYEWLYFVPLFNQSMIRPLPANNQHRQVVVYQSVPFTSAAPQNFYQPPGVLLEGRFSTELATGGARDTLVQLKLRTPPTGDTVRAALRFGH